MAGNATIGALKVSLGIDSAQFTSGLASAQKGLGNFGKIAAVGLAAATTAALAAGAAMAVMGKRAIDSADNLSKVAQKAGVTTEALSRLNHAAGYSDVSLEQLSGGLQKLSKNMADVATGSTGAAATAFAALGVNVTDASGKLRGADEVFSQVAGLFERMENGSTKTALAIQLFGKAGADLIPLLNEGASGLAAMADESDRLGLTVSTKTGKAAEQFNDTLTKVGRIIDGVAMKVAEQALPALQQLADTLASPEVASAAQTLGTTMVTAFNAVVTAVATTTNAIKGFLDWLNGMGGTPGNGAPLSNDLLPGERLNLADRIQSNSANPTPASSLYAGFGFGSNGQMSVDWPTQVKELTVDLNALTTAANASKAAEDALNAAMTEGAAVFAATRTPFEAAQMELDKLGHLLNKGAIDWETYGRAVDAVRMNTAASVIGMAGQITSSLAGLFKDNKAFAVASAVINTAEGVTKALAQGGIWGFAGAAAVAASGAAQIASILSANPGSGSVKSPASTAAAQTPVAPAATGGGNAINLTLEGGGRYSRNELESLFRDMNDAMGDGFKLNVNPA